AKTRAGFRQSAEVACYNERTSRQGFQDCDAARFFKRVGVGQNAHAAHFYSELRLRDRPMIRRSQRGATPGIQRLKFVLAADFVVDLHARKHMQVAVWMPSMQLWKAFQ